MRNRAVGNKSTKLWDLHDEATALMGRDGLDQEERRLLARWEASLVALEVGIALIRHGDIPERFTADPHPWLVRLLANLGPGRILRFLDVPLPSRTAETRKAA